MPETDRDWMKEQFKHLIDPLEEEREFMEKWCLKNDIPYITFFIDYQNRLIDLKTRLEGGFYDETRPSYRVS